MLSEKKDQVGLKENNRINITSSFMYETDSRYCRERTEIREFRNKNLSRASNSRYL